MPTGTFEREITLVVTTDREVTFDHARRMARDAAKAVMSQHGIGSYESSNYNDRTISAIRVGETVFDRTSYPSEETWPITQEEVNAYEYDDDDF